MRDAELSERVGTVAAIIQNEASFALQDVEIIRPISYNEPDDPGDRTGGTVVRQLRRRKELHLEQTEIGRRRKEDEAEWFRSKR